MNWKGWTEKEDVPGDLRAVIAQGEFIPLLDPREASEYRRIILETTAEVMDIYLEEAQLRWVCDHVHRARPAMPMEAVFRAVSIERGISVARLRSIWFVSRRKSRVVEIMRKKIQEGRHDRNSN